VPHVRPSVHGPKTMGAAPTIAVAESIRKAERMWITFAENKWPPNSIGTSPVGTAELSPGRSPGYNCKPNQSRRDG
jgi:hypothetical protein